MITRANYDTQKPKALLVELSFTEPTFSKQVLAH